MCSVNSVVILYFFFLAKNAARPGSATTSGIRIRLPEKEGIKPRPGVAVLAESHISIHSWPENGYAALDVFMCGDAKPEACVPVLRKAFKPKKIAVSELLRGQGV